MNEHEQEISFIKLNEQTLLSFSYVHDRLVMCSFMFDSLLVLLIFLFNLNTSKHWQIIYSISIVVLYIIYHVHERLFIFVCFHLCSEYWILIIQLFVVGRQQSQLQK
ncbi:hypothetical protein Hanom_Chr04g00328421 [Helianthus anomalus]